MYLQLIINFAFAKKMVSKYEYEMSETYEDDSS